MDDRTVRELVREAVARHLAAAPPTIVDPAQRVADVHPSHALYLRLLNAAETCLIEPAVPCSHCGYCKSHGY